MPVVATTKSGREFTRRRHVRVAVQNMTDLVWVFLVDASERELCESLCGFFIERGCHRIFGGESEHRKKNQRSDQNSHLVNLIAESVICDCRIWGAQAASLRFPAACRKQNLFTFSLVHAG